MITVHEFDLNGCGEAYSVDKLFDLNVSLNKFNTKEQNVVFLFALETYNDKDSVLIVTHNFHIIHDMINHYFKEWDIADDDPEVFIQQYSSYEEAYRVALSMKETHPLCYETPN
jgi:hypothetical protein